MFLVVCLLLLYYRCSNAYQRILGNTAHTSLSLRHVANKSVAKPEPEPHGFEEARAVAETWGGSDFNYVPYVEYV
jgi:hypothetical protein